MPKTVNEYRQGLGMTVAEFLALTDWSESKYKKLRCGMNQLNKIEVIALDHLLSTRRPGRPRKVR